MIAVNLKTEHLTDPLGIDLKKVRLMWNCDCGIKQTAYQIKATDSDGKLLWDSGRVNSNRMAYIDYPVATRSRERVNWKVKLWDENGAEGEWSDGAFFETGLGKDGFKAEWITGDYDPSEKNYNKKKITEKSFLISGIDYLIESGKPENGKRYPVDCFKKEFVVKKDVKFARLYATACGIYAAYINGKKVSMPLAPGVTDYNKRVQYQTYDITGLIKDRNVVRFELADGWYRGSCGAWGLKEQYGTRTKLIAQLEITYTDGSVQTVVSDGTWSWSNDGSILFADNKDGEKVDARKSPSYSGRARVTSHSVVPTASNNAPIAEKETFKGKMTVTKSGKKLIDFGQNIAGYISFKINARAGQRIVLRFGEMTDADGELTLKNIQCSNKHITTPLQKIEYICKDGVNEYKTKFAIFGFKLMEIDADTEIKADDFTAIAVYSDMERTGYFDSSNELLNKFVEATVWSTKSNSADLPTDCPTRERHGWTGDAQIFVNTASYLFDYASFADKFERDLCDEQKENGCFGQIAPSGGVDFYMKFMDGSAGWSDAGIFIPYRLYKKYNDISYLEKYYDNMRRFAEFKIKTIGKPYPTAIPTGVGIKYSKYIVNYGQSYGEWAEPEDVKPMETADFISPHPEESTAYAIYMLDVMSEICAVLGRYCDKTRYEEIAAELRIGYQKLVSTKKFSLDTDRQARLVRPLYLNLLNANAKRFAQNRLIKALDNYGWRLGTGFLSTPFILDVLADIDVEYAYRLLENEEMPGWLFMTKSGATTVWESWEGTHAQGGIASLNHYSKGAVCEWLFSSMCGIKPDGENHFIIKPTPGGKFTYAVSRYKSVYGEIKSGWRREGDKYIYNISVAPNCNADIELPDGRKMSAESGEYEF